MVHISVKLIIGHQSHVKKKNCLYIFIVREHFNNLKVSVDLFLAKLAKSRQSIEKQAMNAII